MVVPDSCVFTSVDNFHTRQYVAQRMLILPFTANFVLNNYHTVEMLNVLSLFALMFLSLTTFLLFSVPSVRRAMDLGILAGDAAWTVEPIVSILNPYIVKYVMQRYESRQQQQQRVQIDGMKKEL